MEGLEEDNGPQAWKGGIPEQLGDLEGLSEFFHSIVERLQSHDQLLRYLVREAEHGAP